jgi:hypothetical protein
LNKKQGESALVIGGSLAGLLTVRLLSNHFEQVTILERDLMPNVPEAQKGQAQARHLHGLLVQGLNIITRYFTRYFPNLLEELQSGGTPILDRGQSMRWYCYGGNRARLEFRPISTPVRLISAAMLNKDGFWFIALCCL